MAQLNFVNVILSKIAACHICTTGNINNRQVAGQGRIKTS